MLAELITAGTLLIATPANRDPGFKNTTILVIQSDRQAAVGLVLNRPLPDSAAAWAGGPVPSTPHVVFRCQSQPKDAKFLAPGLCVAVGGRAPVATPAFIVIHGYTGWTAAQLQDEIRRGLWKTRRATPADVFPLAEKPRH